MPDLTSTSNMDGKGGQKWQQGSQLPSFYSPRTGPTESDANNSDVDTYDISAPQSRAQAHSQSQQPVSDSNRPDQTDGRTPSTTSSTPSSLPVQPPPPSLLSPAFTPPVTPGTATPTSSSPFSHSRDEPRSVPVDSSDPAGGCGTKKPQLLERLPNVECIVRARIPTVDGSEMFLHLYTNDVDNKEHLAIVFGGNIRSKSLDAPREGETEMDRMIRGAYTGTLYPGRTSSRLNPDGTAAGTEQDSNTPSQASAVDHGPPLVRIHSECYTGETVRSSRCDCGEQLDEAARLMALPSNKAGGIIIYLRQEGRGIGLGEKLKAYNLQDLGSDTVEANLLLRHPADARSYGLATAMLLDLGQHDVRLLTNNPDKIRAVEGPNREVVVRERVAMVPLSWRGRGGFRSREVEGYLKTKIEKMGHMLDMGSLS